MIFAFDAQSERPGFPRVVRRSALAAANCCCARSASTVYFMPPYVVTDAEFALLVERTLAILDEC